MRLTWLAAAPLLVATPILAQTSPGPQAPAMPSAAASSFASVEVRFAGRYIGGRWMKQPALLEGPSKITITYGQPHARGRQIVGGLIPFDQVWRFGANLATTLHTDVDMTLGGAFIPHGVYSLYAIPTKSGWQLIINRQVGQWGLDYDPAQDVARIPLKSRSLNDPVESFTIYLIPSIDPDGAPPSMPHGTLKLVWEKTELMTDWKVGR